MIRYELKIFDVDTIRIQQNRYAIFLRENGTFLLYPVT